MISTVPLALADYVWPSGERRPLADIYLAVLPLLVSSAIVFLGSLMVGFPVHFALQKTQAHSRQHYIFAGAIAGFLVSLAALAIIDAAAGYWLVFLGALSGGMTARSWSNSLEMPLEAAVL